MKRLLGVSLVAFCLSVSIAAQSESQKVSGHLVDGVCASNHAAEPGYAANHERECNLMDGCIKSGYSVITAEQRVFKFDQTGNEQALALIKATDKNKDFKVVVTGKVDGGTIAVKSIAVQ